VPGATVEHHDGDGNLKGQFTANADGFVYLWRVPGDTITTSKDERYAVSGPTALNAGNSTVTLSPASGYTCYWICEHPVPSTNLDGSDGLGSFSQPTTGGVIGITRNVTVPLTTLDSGSTCTAPAGPGNTRLGYTIAASGVLSIHATLCPWANSPPFTGSGYATEQLPATIRPGAVVHTLSPSAFTCDPFTLEYELTGHALNTTLYGADPVTIEFHLP
jgi:hypothetical protein